VIQHQQYQDAIQKLNDMLTNTASKLKKCQEPVADKQSVQMQLENVQVAPLSSLKLIA
jgi:hypothetical protein